MWIIPYRADAVGESSVSAGHEPLDTTESDTTNTKSTPPVPTGENIATKETTTVRGSMMVLKDCYEH